MTSQAYMTSLHFEITLEYQPYTSNW